MPHQSVNGVNLHYREQGSGLPLVLVHGFPLDGRVWDEQLAALSDRFRVIAPDLRGFGQSASDDSFTIQSLADDLHQLLKQIDALPCVLAGLSMGGYVAFAYLVKYPTDLKGLALIDTRAEADSPEAKEGRGKMIRTVREKGSGAVADAMEAKMVSPTTPQQRPEVARKLRQIMEACPPKTIEHALAAMRDRDDYRDELRSVAVPTLIVVGEDDAITPPAMALGMNKEIAHSTLCVVSKAGHMTPMECPGEVNRALRDFVEGVG